jgi:tripartite-type tricarboxylate transporter receptor subunit TctC
MKMNLWQLLMVIFLLIPGWARADDFYKGKTIRVIVGGSAGGGFDIYTRAMARHMGKHIPGNPALVVENMTGAGTFIAAKYLHSSAKPDGLSFGIFNGALILGRVLGMKGIDIDMRELEYLGVPVQDSTVCALRKESGITNMDQWFAAKTPIKLGGLSPGNSTSDVARVLSGSLGLPIQLVEGYKGTNEIRLAADAGELHGACWAWETLKVAWSKAIPAGDVNIVLQVTAKRIPELSNVPMALDLAKSDEARLLLKAGAIDPAAIVRVYVTTPRTPKDRLETLRKAFADTLKDPEFVAEAKKSNLDINPLSGDEVKKTVDGLFKLNPSSSRSLLIFWL